MRRQLHLFLAGLWFAAAQLGGLFLLQTQYTASLTSFLLTTSAWLAGAAVGVWMSDSKCAPWLWLLSGFAMTSLTQLWLLGSASPLARAETSWLLLVLASLVAGQLFTQHFSLGSSLGRVFFVEATGFTTGTLVATVMLMLYGLEFVQAAPILTPILAALSWRLEKGARCDPS